MTDQLRLDIEAASQPPREEAQRMAAALVVNETAVSTDTVSTPVTGGAGGGPIVLVGPFVVAGLPEGRQTASWDNEA